MIVVSRIPNQEDPFIEGFHTINRRASNTIGIHRIVATIDNQRRDSVGMDFDHMGSIIRHRDFAVANPTYFIAKLRFTMFIVSQVAVQSIEPIGLCINPMFIDNPFVIVKFRIVIVVEISQSPSIEFLVPSIKHFIPSFVTLSPNIVMDCIVVVDLAIPFNSCLDIAVVSLRSLVTIRHPYVALVRLYYYLNLAVQIVFQIEIETQQKVVISLIRRFVTTSFQIELDYWR